VTAGTTLARLDRETAGFHQEADSGWSRLLQPEATREDYLRKLCITYGFEAPFEAAAAYTPGLSLVVDLRGRARSGLIAQDLLSLGLTPDRITGLHTYSIAPFQDAAEALGWMYVVERPTLRYEAIREHVTNRFTDLMRATTYLSAYDTHTNRRWAELGKALDRVCLTDTVRDRILEAAHDAFACVLEWQRSHGPALRSVG